MAEVMQETIDENNALRQDICACAYERWDDCVVKDSLDRIEEFKDYSAAQMGKRVIALQCSDPLPHLA